MWSFANKWLTVRDRYFDSRGERPPSGYSSFRTQLTFYDEKNCDRKISLISPFWIKIFDRSFFGKFPWLGIYAILYETNVRGFSDFSLYFLDQLSMIAFIIAFIINKSKYYGNKNIMHFEYLEVFSERPLLDIILISIFRRCSWWFLVKMESFDTHLCHWNREKNFRKDPFGSKKNFWYFFRAPVIRKEMFQKNYSKFFFEPKGHFRTFFRKIFLSTMTSGKFYVDPKIFSP